VRESDDRESTVGKCDTLLEASRRRRNSANGLHYDMKQVGVEAPDSALRSRDGPGKAHGEALVPPFRGIERERITSHIYMQVSVPEHYSEHEGTRNGHVIAARPA